MFRITARDLERQAVFKPEKSQVIFHEKIFTRGPDFSKNLHSKAVKFCQRYSKLELETLLVEHPLYLEIWIQNNKVLATAEKSQ